MKLNSIIISVLALATLPSCYADRVLKTTDTPVYGSWGDQGDGTFVNPILNSNYPDSDVEYFDGKWYMISSKGCYMKGMTVLESEDLVNWEITGGIVDSLTWETSEGVWAGDLIRRGDEWLCYFIDYDKGLFVCRSRDAREGWSEPYLILNRPGMTDPAVYWDDESGQAYMLCNSEIENVNGNRIYHQRLFKMSQDGMSLIDDGRDIYVSEGVEAAKIYHIDGYFYIFLSEWVDGKDGKRDRKQIVLRAEDIYGPYEKRVILEKGNGIERSCCQGSLIMTPDSSWWYMHQLVQSKNTIEGRPQLLIPVKWQDGWPLLGEDTDGNGIGNVVMRCRKPVQGKPLRMVAADDDFNSSKLSGQWLWDGNPIEGQWSLNERKGYLRLHSVKPVSDKDVYKTLPGKILQRKMGTGMDTVTVRMDVRGMVEGQSAGLVHKGLNSFVIGARMEGGRVSIYKEYKEELAEEPLGRHRYVWFRTIADGLSLSASFSTDGRRYSPIGEISTMETRGFNGIFIGLFSMNRSGEGYADFDWFEYKYDGPKSEALTGTKPLFLKNK